MITKLYLSTITSPHNKQNQADSQHWGIPESLRPLLVVMQMDF